MFKWIDDTFIKPVENSKAPLGLFILLSMGYIAVRNLLEGTFEALHILGLSTITLNGLEEVFLHLNFAWMFMFMTAIILIHFVTGHDIRKITKVVLTYSFLIILPPIIDSLFRAGGFYLFYPTDINTIVTVFKAALRPWLIFQKWQGANVPYGSSPGMVIEGYLGLIMVITYIARRTKPLSRKIFAIVISPLILTLSLGIAGTSGIFHMLASRLIPHDPVSGMTIFFTGGLVGSVARKNALILLFPFVLVFFLGIWLYNKEKTRKLIRSLNPLTLTLTALATVAGFFFAWMGLKDILIGVPRNPFDYLALLGFIIFGIFTAALKIFAGKAADESLDEASRKTFKRGAIGAFVFAGVFIWSLGYAPLFIWVVALALMMVIELPPLRLKRFLLPSAISNAMFILVLVICGYSIFTTNRTMNVFPWQIALAVFAVMTVVFLGIDFIKRLPASTERKSIGVGEAEES